MTEKLYYADSHLMRFSARVLRLESLPGGSFTAVLDRTHSSRKGADSAPIPVISARCV